jgi:hypothetical protein
VLLNFAWLLKSMAKLVRARGVVRAAHSWQTVLLLAQKSILSSAKVVPRIKLPLGPAFRSAPKDNEKKTYFLWRWLSIDSE